MKAKGCKNLKK